MRFIFYFIFMLESLSFVFCVTSSTSILVVLAFSAEWRERPIAWLKSIFDPASTPSYSTCCFALPIKPLNGYFLNTLSSLFLSNSGNKCNYLTPFWSLKMRHWIFEKSFLVWAFRMRIVLMMWLILISFLNLLKPRLNILSLLLSLRQQRHLQHAGK